MTDRELYEIALGMLPRSYAPFSKFRVGAALLTKDGKVYTGVNIENSSFGGTICAERTAFVKAVSEGDKEFSKVAIASSGGEAWPCGICRQVMSEFAGNGLRVILYDGKKTESMSFSELLPYGFTKENLE